MRLNRKMTAGHVLLLLLIWQAAAVPDGQAGSCYHANGTIKFGGFDTAAYGCDPPEPPPTTQAPPKAPPEAAPGAALSALWDLVCGVIDLSPAVTDVAALHLALWLAALAVLPWRWRSFDAVGTADPDQLRRLAWAAAVAVCTCGRPADRSITRTAAA
jgi:hypothetical protein